MPVDDVEQARINDRRKDSEIKMGKYKAVILDWAGTTVDYGCFAPVQAFVEVFKHFGIDPTMDEVREPMGMLKKDHIRTMLKMDRISGLWRDKYGRDWTEDDVEALYAQFEGKLLAILDGYTQVKPYVLETVDTLRKNGIQIGSTTGYTDKMMDIVVPKAKENGYAPDFWFSPDSVEGMGRPYPYMIFKNMAAMKIQSVDQVVKVGDTVSDIKEGKNAGVLSIGVVEGSSELGLTQAEYEALSDVERDIRVHHVKERFLAAGADRVIMNLKELPDILLR